MNTPSELLATLLLADQSRARIAADEISERDLWTNQIRLAFTWRALPQLRAALTNLEVELDRNARGTLDELSAASAAESALVSHCAAQALGALEDAGIRVAAFKGFGMIASLYRSASDRMLSDADVLIENVNFRAAVRVLARVGFKPDVSLALEEWLDLLDQRVYRVHDFLDFSNDSGVKIDLHWRVRTPSSTGFPISEMIERAEAHSFSGSRVRVVRAEDSILLTTHHLVRDRFAPRSTVKDLSDIKAWLDMAEKQWTVESLVERARSTGLISSLLAALTILSRFEPGQASEAASGVATAATAAEIETSDRLADVFALQLERGTISDLVVGLTAITPSLARRFVVSRVRSLTDSKYRAHKFAGESRTSFGVAAREAARDLFTLTPKRLALYRALGHETRDYLGEETR